MSIILVGNKTIDIAVQATLDHERHLPNAIRPGPWQMLRAGCDRSAVVLHIRATPAVRLGKALLACNIESYRQHYRLADDRNPGMDLDPALDVEAYRFRPVDTTDPYYVCRQLDLLHHHCSDAGDARQTPAFQRLEAARAALAGQIGGAGRFHERRYQCQPLGDDWPIEDTRPRRAMRRARC